MSCPICIAPYNKSLNCRVVCPDQTCSYEACKECMRTYFLGTTQDPHCMNCRKAFDPQFVTTNLNVSWIKSTYREHRKKLLVEREISRIPDTMGIVDNQRQIRKLEKEDEQCKQAIHDLKDQLRQMQGHRYTIQRDINTLRRGGNPNAEKKQFIMPCPDEGCRGFLSTGYKCGACEKFTCSKCHEIIGLSKTDNDHVCNEDSVKSAELIKKETKPCPKCGERIMKISGCDQMWCPTCQTAFSWRTGAVDLGVVHNPHFYQWQRAGGAAPRNPGDVVCGGLRDWWRGRTTINRFITHFPTIPSREQASQLLRSTGECHRSINHIIHTVVNRLRDDVRANDENQHLRVSYILKEITKEQLAATLVKKDNIRKKNTELLHVWELVQTVAIESFNAYYDDVTNKTTAISALFPCRSNTANPPPTIPHEYVAQFLQNYNQYHETYKNHIDAIIEYANTRFAIISATFNCCAPKLLPLLGETTQKAKQSVLKAKSDTLYPAAEGAV